MTPNGRFPSLARMRSLLHEALPLLSAVDRRRVNASLAGHLLRWVVWGALMVLGSVVTGLGASTPVAPGLPTFLVLVVTSVCLGAYCVPVLGLEARRRLHLVLLEVLPLVAARRRSPGGGATPAAVTVGDQPADAVWDKLALLAGPGEAPARRGGCLVLMGLLTPLVVAAVALVMFAEGFSP